MALPLSNAQQDHRKILEELQQKKQQLLKGGAPTLNTTITTANLLANPQGLPPVSDLHMINSAQRIALRNANNTSFGYFVPTDSSFGNQILPVLPRVENEQ